MNERFIGFFLDFDPYSFFQVLKKLFLEHEPYDYLRSQTAFVEQYKNQVIGLEPCMTHEEMIEHIDGVVQEILKKDRQNKNDLDGEEAKENENENETDDAEEGELTARGEALQNSFMFFITQISKKSKIHMTEELCLRTVSQQILFHKKLLKLDKEELKPQNPRVSKLRFELW